MTIRRFTDEDNAVAPLYQKTPDELYATDRSQMHPRLARLADERLGVFHQMVRRP